MSDSEIWALTGAADRLAGSAVALRRAERVVSDRLLAEGFEEVIPPLVDAVEVFALAGEEVARLIDRSGRVLALRADFTGPVARIAGVRFRARAGALRLSYKGAIFRYRDRLLEQVQAGAELFGVAGVEADAEMVRLAVQVLADAGIAARVAIGSVEVVEALLPETAAVRHALDKRDRRALVELPEVRGLDAERRRAVEALLDLAGERDVLVEARRRLPGCEGPLDRLEALAERLVGVDVWFDLAHVRTPAYYTGVVFDLYAEGVPRAVAGGGRYDGLAGRYGPDRPAVGVAFDLDAIADRISAGAVNPGEAE